MRKPKSFSPRMVLGAIFCAVVFVILATIAARTGRTLCIGQHSTGECGFVSYVSAYWANVGTFIEANEGPIEACGTLFVAIFTFTLWTATEKLGVLAKEQGEAMERSISEAAKATLATNAIATATKDNAALMQGHPT